jgi:hypothetical protein
MSIRFVGILILLIGCARGDPDPPPAPVERVDVGTLAGMRIFFGHQSVGREILAGVREVAPELTIVSLDAAPGEGAGLIEGAIGHNQHPQTKDRAFLDAVSGRGDLDLALYKYCFVDVDEHTDPVALFSSYRTTLEAASARGVRVVPVTLPLTTIEPGWKLWGKRLIGRPTQVELNALRLQFNELMREHYGTSAIVDLARIESTREDGSRCLVQLDEQFVEYLVPGFTYDGSHLNGRGRRHVARRFVESLRAVAPPSSP